MNEENKKIDPAHENCDCSGSCSENGGCGCGCGHDHDGEDHDYVTLVLEDDTELQCPIIDIFGIEEQDYIALLHPADETVMLYRFADYEDGTIEIDSIEDEAEFELVSKTFNALTEAELETE